MSVYSLGDKSSKFPNEGDYWIAPGAHVLGQVELGKNVGIWFGSVLRGDNDLIKIGDETNIQENTIIHVDPGCPVTIGRNCTIGHNAIIHGCTIGNNTLIGMGATILNNAKIGNNCLVGAGALVTENKEFPDGSLIVGSPAKAVRELSQDMIDNMTRSSKHYVTNFKKFINGRRCGAATHPAGTVIGRPATSNRRAAFPATPLLWLDLLTLGPL